MSNKVVAFRQESFEDVVNFSWSCRPILCFIRLIGIPLTPGRPKNRFGFRLECCFALAFYVVNIVNSVMYTVERITHTRDESQNPSNSSTSTTIMNAYVYYLNYNASSILTHTALIFVAIFGWHELIDALRNLELLHTFKTEDYQRFRTPFMIGLFFVITVSIYTNYLIKNNAVKQGIFIILRISSFNVLLGIKSSLQKQVSSSRYRWSYRLSARFIRMPLQSCSAPSDEWLALCCVT